MTDRGYLADLLLRWRSRLQAASVGLVGGSTKLAGLRREEVAMLAGLSVDYLVRLEQGRARHPSNQVASALARALQLSVPERDQLFRAADLPVPLPAHAPTHVPGSVQRLLLRAPDIAIGVYTVHWTLLQVNRAWEALLGRYHEGFNLVEAQFTGTASTVEASEEYFERFERALVTGQRHNIAPGPAGFSRDDVALIPRTGVLAATAHRDGPLRIGFEGEQTLEVRPSPHFESCNISTAEGIRGLRIVALPGGGPAVWKTLQ